MKPIVAAPIVALALAGAGAGAYFLATSGGGEEGTLVVQPTLTPEPSGTATAAPTVTPTPEPAGTRTAVPPPDDWETYVDPELGFKLDYPPDLSFRDVAGANQLGVEFRSIEEPSRALVLSASENAEHITMEQWAIEFAACQPESLQEAILGGQPAISCTREVIEGFPEPAALAALGNRIFLISHTGLTEAEFEKVIEAFQFQP